MAVCTFFGHKDCPNKIGPALEILLADLIENKNVTVFYVGNQGNFDFIVRSYLEKIKGKYPYINYYIVLAYMPTGNEFIRQDSFNITILPEGIENVPKRFAISWRNKWMLARSDFVVAYIEHDWGGAVQYAERALKQHKQVFNLGSLNLQEL